MTADISQFMASDKLLGPYFEGPSWDRWRAVIRAAFALPMTEQDLALFREVAERDPPPHPVRELVCIIGRGGGKDSIASAVGAYIATTAVSQRVRPGEHPTIICVATDREQAAIARSYIAGYFDQVPILTPPWSLTAPAASCGSRTASEFRSSPTAIARRAA